MKRREVLKTIGLAGVAMATPSVFSLLQGCVSDSKVWIPRFLTEEEQIVLINIVDIMLPKTEHTPSATEVKVPQFIDTYIDQVLSTKNQEVTRDAFTKIILILKSKTSKIQKVTEKQYKELLDTRMLIKGEIDEERKASPEALSMTTSEFLNQLKWMTINAYKTSEQVGENVLAYDPIPGAYYCGDLQELTHGKSWSLK